MKNKELTDEEINKRMLIGYIAMFIAIALITAGCVALYIQINPAYKFCNSVPGNFSVDILHSKIYCNGETIIRYRSGMNGKDINWAFEKDVEAILGKGNYALQLNLSQLDNRE